MSYYFIFLIKRDCYYIYRQSLYAFEPLPLKLEFRTAMLLDPNETANWIPYVIPLGPTTESHIIRYLFPERSLGRVPVDLAFATTMHLPFNESIFPENSGICALLFYLSRKKIIWFSNHPISHPLNGILSRCYSCMGLAQFEFRMYLNNH